ncbi:MAG: hypothetical protein A2017_13980 [Lentisphaerae bacterium GWF2_44_16]|nr:MAG: hypothetical protein A2017_13980 [Lentisphaerae bacterium GWF2_44_16]
MSIIEASILIFLVMDPLGNIPMFLVILKNVKKEKRKKIIIRELLIALLIMVFLLFGGRYILEFLDLSETSLRISGGIILFLIAIKMIFSGSDSVFNYKSHEEPFIVPLAVPLVAGPSIMATIILLMSHEPARWPEWLLAIIIAWLPASLILIYSYKIFDILSERVLTAIENLMGMLLTTIAVEMFIKGIRAAFF